MHCSAKRGIAIASRPSVRPSVCLSARLSVCDVGGWWEKVACWPTKAAISLKCIKTDEKLLWRAYELINALSNGTIPDPLT